MMKKFNRVAPWVAWLLLLPSLVFGQQIINRTMQGGGSEWQLFSDGHYRLIVNANGSSEIDGFVSMPGIAAPANAPLNTGTMYYDLAGQTWKIGANAGAYQPITIAPAAAAGQYIQVPNVGPFAPSGTSPCQAVANKVIGWLVEVPVQITITTCWVNVSTGVGGSHVGVGLYSLAGNLVYNATLSSPAAGVSAGAIAQTSVTVSAGWYYGCTTSENATVAVDGIAFTSLSPLFTNQGTIAMTGSNASAAGVLPSTLGTISAGTFTSFPVFLSRN